MVRTNRVQTCARFVISPLTVHISTTKDLDDIKPQDYLTMQALSFLFYFLKGGSCPSKEFHKNEIFFSRFSEAVCTAAELTCKFSTKYLQSAFGMFSGILVDIYSGILMASSYKSLVLSQVSCSLYDFIRSICFQPATLQNQVVVINNLHPLLTSLTYLTYAIYFDLF